MDDMFGMILSSLSPEKKLLSAIENNMVGTVQQLLSEGGSDLANAVLSKQRESTALHIVCKMDEKQKRYNDIIRILLDNGANVNKADFFGYTPLHIAVERGNLECALLLLENSNTCIPGAIWHGLNRISMVQPILPNNVQSNRPWSRCEFQFLSKMVIATPKLFETYPAVEQHIKESVYVFAENSQLPGSAQFIKDCVISGNKLDQNLILKVRYITLLFF